MTHSGFQLVEDVPIRLNLAIDLIYPDGRVAEHHKSHNIIVNNGKQFMSEVITPATLSGSAFTRHNNEVVRYIGFGIGGNRQTNADALNPASVLSTAYPAPGTPPQTDVDVTVSRLDRPVQVTSAPLWMREIATGVPFPTTTSTTFIAMFSQADLNFGSFPTVPLSEIALYKSGADPSLSNGTLGAYPGVGGEVIAYDVFNPIEKSGLFAIQARWTWRF